MSGGLLSLCLLLFGVEFVLVDVALEYVGAGSQYAFEARPVHLDALERPGVWCYLHRGRPRLVQQQSDLACNATDGALKVRGLD